ncbi:Atu4866 domain-containing protein [Roseomonas sp. SSH11]|uniref:Atu4866 domain-containing protein n=1 Tax=Pararoseomonas baculiformis TaxID=2820812 RepID=A0ABS4ACL1_9PROT|nr:Atu4866 domain-containing protein [Pararoseomonas baculiformis]MBP0444752.1 Atu4866 domain-containing protein [Pararoseomonas baculiformis]
MQTEAAWPLFLATLLAHASLAGAQPAPQPTRIERSAEMSRITDRPSPAPDNPYVGMWVTADGRIRHELLSDGRYDEARGNRQSAYRGRYWLEGNRIEYLDDTGFTADGEFRDGVLHHGGMIFHRENARN